MLVDFAIAAELERNMPPLAAIRMFGRGAGSEMRYRLGNSTVG
jgi:hypothetical protein